MIAWLDSLRGWLAVAALLGFVALGTLGGLIHGRASVAKFFAWPIASVFFGVAAFIAMAVVEMILNSYVGGHWEARYGWLRIPAMVVIGYLCGRLMCRGDDVRVVRGTVLVDGTSPARRTTRSIARARRRGAVTLAGVPVPREDEVKHFKLIGTTGTGKTTAIEELLEGALARGDRAVIADPGGAYIKRFHDAGRGDVILNPFDPRSAAWDLGREIEAAYDVDHIARALIPDQPDAGGAEWRAYARTLFSAVARHWRRDGARDVRVLWRLLTVASSEELRPVVRETPAQPFLEEANARMFGSVRSVTASAVAPLEYIASPGGEGFSIRNWIRSGQGVLFIPYNATQIATLRTLISAWMRIAIFETLTRGEGDQRLWFTLDELDALGPVDGLKDALAQLRKFGGRCVLGFQSIAQVSGIYGPSESQTIVENCANSLILRCSASEDGGTARFASRLIGEREIIRETVSSSHGTGVEGQSHQSRSSTLHHVTESAVLASEIEQLPDLAGFLKLASSPEWRRVTLTRPRL